MLALKSSIISPSKTKARAAKTKVAKSTAVIKPPTPFADVLKFQKAGMSIQRYCKANGMDVDELCSRIKKWRRVTGGAK